ncbi:DgyrCDS11952 [Dimorphilus gyrociliatus]|uniref:DgyrCDS11952 n=1 Tax=Dimorphilus gyrociliatus TaxID=2664684 RepID=A0A7I8W8E4_9ANNE|nr:DgyrCDS11952 [Dimorphilus gyrociliatus]
MFSLAKSSALLDYVNGVCSEFYDSFLNRLYQGIAKTAPSREDIQGVGWLSGLAAGIDRVKEEARKQNEQLNQECSLVQSEYKRMKSVIDQLSKEYEESKDIDVFRRYAILKGMIKRCIMHLTLSNDEQVQSQLANTRIQEEMKKKEEQLAEMTSKEISNENDGLQTQIKEYRIKINMIRDLISTMERRYEESKRYVMIQRYGLMKSMIKTLITNKWI